jgi:hypothetical protein
MNAAKLVMLGLLFTCCFTALSQAPIRKLPQSINRPNVNVTAPFISLDGNTLVFTLDYAGDNEPLVHYTQKDDANWKAPKALPKHVNGNLNFGGGYTLSADGSTLYLTSIKSGGVGGFDIWAGKLFATSWGELQNLYLPINTTLHEGCPTFTTDGNTMFFMRCTTMTQKKAEGCKIMVTKKAANGKWEEPVELPPQINTGNSQSPRISADGDILIFSSNMLQPNKGGMDLYASKYKNGSWTNPEALDFVNTETDDQFVSLIANGRYILKDAPGKFNSELIEYLVPETWRPPASMKIDGLITNAAGTPASAYISVIDQSTQSRVFSGRPDKDGSYFLYLKEGSSYELAIDPEESSYAYFSKSIDMTNTGNPLSMKVDAALKPVQPGDTLALDLLRFKPYSAQLDGGNSELRRLSRLIKASPQFNYELKVHLIGYEEDSVQSHADLTEITIDSVLIQLDDVDTLGNISSRDSLIVETIYHNNRTEMQAQAILNELIILGVEPTLVSYTIGVQPEEVAKNRRIKIRMVVKNKQ